MLFLYSGESAALFTAIFWTISSLSLQSVTKKYGSPIINLLCQIIAMFFLTFYCRIYYKSFFIVNPTSQSLAFLICSGFIGFFLGDLCLLKAFEIIGARITMLIYTSVPVITTIIAWLFLSELPGLKEFCGIFSVLAGIGIAILMKSEKKIGFSLSKQGIFYSVAASFGQAFGLIFGKIAMTDIEHAVFATQIRLIPSILAFFIFVFFTGDYKKIWKISNSGKDILNIFSGSFFGLVLGVTLSLVAIKQIEAGVASTIMAITPILIIPPAILLFKEKVRFQEIVGAVIAILGVALLFL